MNVAIRLRGRTNRFRSVLNIIPSHVSMCVKGLTCLVVLTTSTATLYIFLFTLLCSDISFSFCVQPLAVLVLSTVPLCLVSVLTNFALNGDMIVNVNVAKDLLSTLLTAKLKSYV